MNAPTRPLSKTRSARQKGSWGVCTEPGCMLCRRQQARHGALPTFLFGPLLCQKHGESAILFPCPPPDRHGGCAFRLSRRVRSRRVLRRSRWEDSHAPVPRRRRCLGLFRVGLLLVRTSCVQCAVPCADSGRRTPLPVADVASDSVWLEYKMIQDQNFRLLHGKPAMHSSAPAYR